LRDLREAAGRTTIKDPASAMGYIDATVRGARRGRLQQSRRALQAVAAALGGDAEEYGRRWEDLDLALHPPQQSLRGRRLPQRPWGPWCSAHRRHKELYGDPTAGRFSPKTHPEVGSVEGRERPYRARGLCKSRYDRYLAARGALAVTER
jgi:hypothetical protein